MRLLCIAALLLSGCAHQPELTILAGPRWSDGEREIAATFMLIQRFGERGVGGCVHNSIIDKGEPFNDRPEVVFDSCGAGMRFGGKAR